MKSLRRALVLVSLGGMAFSFGFLGFACQPFAESQPYINFVEDVGDFAVDVAVDNALDSLNNQDLKNWLDAPVTTLYQNLWSGWVRNEFPQDPTYNTLLVN